MRITLGAIGPVKSEGGFFAVALCILVSIATNYGCMLAIQSRSYWLVLVIGGFGTLFQLIFFWGLSDAARLSENSATLTRLFEIVLTHQCREWGHLEYKIVRRQVTALPVIEHTLEMGQLKLSLTRSVRTIVPMRILDATITLMLSFKNGYNW